MQYLLNLCACLVIVTCALSCTADQTSQAQIGETGLPEDFTEFYVKFHRDTAFQMSHIAWPLKGIAAGFGTGSEQVWVREDWTPHTQIPSSIEYNQTFNVLSDDLIVETIREKQGNNAMQRRFAKLADGWALIYYVEMQPSAASE